MGPAIIGAVGSVVGGLLGRQKQVKPGDVVRQTMAGILGQARGAREVGEAYGFNPMALLGVSQPLVPQAVDNSLVGQGIANAALAVAEGLNEKTRQAAYASALEEQNAELRKALDTATLRPKVPGIFGTPSAIGAGVVSVPAVSPVGSAAYGAVDPQSMYTPYLSRSGEVVQVAEGTDVEDVGSAVVMNVVGELQSDGTIDRGYIDRLQRNAEGLLSGVARPILSGAKSVASYLANQYLDGPERRLMEYSDKRYGSGRWRMLDDGTAVQE